MFTCKYPIWWKLFCVLVSLSCGYIFYNFYWIPENPKFWGWVFFFVFPASIYGAFGFLFTNKVVDEESIREVYAVSFFGRRIEYTKKYMRHGDITKIYDFGEKVGYESGVNIAIAGNRNRINFSTKKDCDRKALKYVASKTDTKLIDKELKEVLDV